MTMVDKVCPVVREDLRKIYFSKKIKEMVCMFVCEEYLHVCSHTFVSHLLNLTVRDRGGHPTFWDVG